MKYSRFVLRGARGGESVCRGCAVGGGGVDVVVGWFDDGTKTSVRKLESSLLLTKFFLDWTTHRLSIHQKIICRKIQSKLSTDSLENGDGDITCKKIVKYKVKIDQQVRMD